MDDLLDNVGTIIFIVVWILAGLWRTFQEKKKAEESLGPVDIERAALDAVAAVELEPLPAAEAWPEDESESDVPADLERRHREERDKKEESLKGLIDAAESLIDSIRHDRANEKFIDVLSNYVIARAGELDSELRAGHGEVSLSIDYAMADLLSVFRIIGHFVAQRRYPERRSLLGDADEFAMACYEPFFEFARINRVPLTSATPVTDLGPFNLSIWTGFIPTGLAPLFLPQDFFRRVAWWPAVAHEIGHDVLAATTEAEAHLRSDLGLPGEDVGRVPLSVARGITGEEIVRVYGGWFEEVFCDVFGTMMLGPAYGYTMVNLFRNEPGAHQVGLDRGGRRYVAHPPRHLRVLLCAEMLELLGEHEDAKQVLSEWHTFHPETDVLLFASDAGLLPIPVEPVLEIGRQIIAALYREPLTAFDGHALSDIPGLDFGPHAAAEADRVKRELLAGRTPSGRHVRAVVSGTVLAWREEPDREQEFMWRARVAIVGDAEWVEGHDDAEAATADSAELSPREAFVLHTILSPPPSARWARGILSRPSP